MVFSELDKLRRVYDLSIIQFAEIVGVSRQTYYDWKSKGEVPEFESNLFLRHISDNHQAANLPEPRNINATKSEIKQVPHSEYMQVSFLSIEAQAGYMDSLESNQPPELDTMLVPIEFEKGNYLVVEVSGESMNDGTIRSIADGDRLLCKDLQKHHWRNKLHYKQYLFVIVGHDGIVCKQITGHDVERGEVICHSWNPLYKDYVINLNNVYQLLYVKKIVERRIKF